MVDVDAENVNFFYLEFVKDENVLFFYDPKLTILGRIAKRQNSH